jgi:enoyl-CoA hydratase/carnithine racemase
VRAVVLTGTGSAFSAGGDLDSLIEQLDWPATRNEAHMREFYGAYLALLQIEVPVIAAINGHAIGAGLSFTLACDIRLAAEGARMGVTFVNLGLHPGMGTLHLLPIVVGHSRATDLILSGRLIDASEAKAIGLVDAVHPRDALMPAALELAKQLAAKPGTAVRTSKQVLVARKLAGLDEALEHDAKVQSVGFASPELRDALTNMRARVR